VKEVEIRQGLLGQFFNYGTLVLYNHLTKRETSLNNVSNPEEVANLLESFIRSQEEK
jgi:hypothetical protein